MALKYANLLLSVFCYCCYYCAIFLFLNEIAPFLPLKLIKCLKKYSVFKFLFFSTFGCPYAPGNINKIDSAFQDRVIITKESLNDFTKRVSEQGGTMDGLRFA